jgi:cold shock CspA family protein
MAKSQETFSKKEKEKKRIKKRQDKLLKKEERKANSEGGSLESMMAYVDEFGNITDTPPDPTKKTKINASSIEIGIPKREDEPDVSGRQGKVTFFNESKGYGFIKDMITQENVFVHINGVDGTITENDLVTFEVERTVKGMSAINVKKI